MLRPGVAQGWDRARHRPAISHTAKVLPMGGGLGACLPSHRLLGGRGQLARAQARKSRKGRVIPEKAALGAPSVLQDRRCLLAAARWQKRPEHPEGEGTGASKELKGPPQASHSRPSTGLGHSVTFHPSLAWRAPPLRPPSHTLPSRDPRLGPGLEHTGLTQFPGPTESPRNLQAGSGRRGEQAG